MLYLYPPECLSLPEENKKLYTMLSDSIAELRRKIGAAQTRKAAILAGTAPLRGRSRGIVSIPESLTIAVHEIDAAIANYLLIIDHYQTQQARLTGMGM